MERRFKVLRWIFLPLAVLSNAFLIIYSCLSMETTSNWNWFVTNIFSGLINSVTETKVEDIPMTELSISLSNEKSYKYNYIPGYEVNEIPLGSAKQIECSYAPENTTDKSIEYYAEDVGMISLSQSGNTVSIVGLKEGTATIHGRNKLSGLVSSIEVKVVNTVAPRYFEISETSTNVQIGSQYTVDFDIDGGNLGHNELINFRYYDIRKLTYSSSNESVFKVDNNGVIYPQSVGDGTLSISNSYGVAKTMSISVIDGSIHPDYSALTIIGENVCYDNDMIKDQGSGKYHQQLIIKDGTLELNPTDFIWESSNELLAKVDKHGIVRGFRKSKTEDEDVIITAKSKLTGQQVSFSMVVKEQLPESMAYWITYGNKDTWMPESFTACNGDTFTTTVSLTPNVSNKKIVAESPNNELIEISSQGSSFTVRVLGVGDSQITFYPEANPTLKATISLTLLKAGAINENNIVGVGLTLRKVLGHALVFAIAQVFTCLTCYFFLYDKKIWIFPAISFSISLLVATISEIIELNIPSRSGTFIDVLIDMAGVVTALAIVFLTVFFIRRKKEKEQTKEDVK